MKSDENLIQEVRILKATKGIDNYYELAELLEMNERSFYNWLNGAYCLGHEKKKKLKELINCLSIC